MATRSKVGFKNSDGTVNASYVHFDGYLDGVGVALQLNHNDDASAKKLGYAKGIRSVETDKPVSFYNDMENDTYESEDQFHDEVYKDFEYGYLYDPSRGWLFTSKKYDTGEFIELEDQLMYDELLPGSGEYVGDLEEDYGFPEEKVQDKLMYAIQDLDKLEYFEFFEKYQAGLNPTDANAVSNWISDLDDEQAEGLLYALNANTGTMSDEEAMDDIMHDGPDRYSEDVDEMKIVKGVTTVSKKPEKYTAENEGEYDVNVTNKVEDEAELGLEESEDDWIQKGEESGEIKAGGLHKALGIPEDEKIPAGLINKKLAQLKKKDKDKGEKGVQGLSKADLKLQRQLNLAKSFKKMDEIHDPGRGNTLKEHFKRFLK